MCCLVALANDWEGDLKDEQAHLLALILGPGQSLLQVIEGATQITLK
jgi:hypothetical protein